MPQDGLVEGRTGVLPDGTRVVVRGGRVVPVDAPPPTGPEAAGFESLGGGWYRGPDGGSYQVGRGGAMVKRSGAPDGAGSDDMDLRAAAELRGRLVLSLGSTTEANQRLEAIQRSGYSFNDDWGARMLEAIPFDGGTAARVAGGNDYQRLETASRSFEAAMLPVFSGAAVTESEARRFIRANLPALGDSGETLETKARNRRLMMNGAATLLGQDIPYPDLGVFGAMFGGTPQEMPYDVAAPVAAQIGLAGGGPAPSDPQSPPAAPGSDPNNPFDFTTASREDVIAAIQRGGWFRQGPDGEPYQLPPGSPEFGMQEGDQAVAPGVAMRPQSSAEIREDASGDRSEFGKGIGRRADAFMRGAADFLTFGTADEIAAGLDTVIPATPGSRSGWTDGFGEAYRNNVAVHRGIDSADAQDMPITRGAGQVAGGVMAAPRAVAGLAGRPMLQQMGRGMAGGTAYGGAYGFGTGEGNALERLPSAGQGAVVGAVAGGVAPPLINAGGRVVSPVVNALADGGRWAARPIVNAMGDSAPQALRSAVEPNDLARGLERFAGTNRPNVNALNTRRVELEGAAGRPVAAANLVNTGGRAMLRGVATRSDAAREIAENFGQGTAEALPARMSGQARRILSNDTRSPDELRGALTAERGGLAREQYAVPYGEVVDIDDGVVSALQGQQGRASLARARSEAEGLRDEDTVRELDAVREWLNPADGGAYGPPRVSARALDYIRQAMTGRGRQASARPGGGRMGAGYQSRAADVDDALDNVEGLQPARQAYRDMSRQIEAVDAGEQFMGNTPDNVAAAMRGAPESAQAPFRTAAARSIERAAGTTGAAPGVANRLAIPGTPQRQMMDETLGPDTAQRLAAAARAERDIYRGAQQVDPGVGSQNTNNAMKAMDAAGAVGDLAAGRPLGAVRRVIGLLDSRGFNPQQAEAVLEAMTDPRRTDEVMAILSERMSRREARALTRTLRHQLTIGLQSGQQN